MATKKPAHGTTRKIGRRSRNYAALSERYTLSTLPDREVDRVVAFDRYFAVRGGGSVLGVARKGRVAGWIDVGRLNHPSVHAWMRHVGQPSSAPKRNPAPKSRGLALPSDATASDRRKLKYDFDDEDHIVDHVNDLGSGESRHLLVRGGRWEVDTHRGGRTTRKRFLSRADASAFLHGRTRNPAPKAPKRKRAGRPLREGQRVYHCAKKCR